MHLVSSRARIQTQICSSKPHIYFVFCCEWALNKNESFHSTPKSVSLNVIHSRIVTYKDYYHQDLERVEGVAWTNSRRLPRDMLPADAHRVLPFLGPDPQLSPFLSRSHLWYSWDSKRHSAAAPTRFLCDSASHQGPCSQHWDEFAVEQPWWHLTFIYSHWHWSQACFHVCGPVFTQPYALVTHLPASGGFLSVRWLESEIQVPSLPIYKPEGSH